MSVEISNQQMMDVLNAHFNQMNDRFNQMNTKIDNVERKLELYRTEVNEHSIREKVRSQYGEKFGRPFVIHGLNGLARLIMPSKKILYPYSPRNIDKVDEFKNPESCLQLHAKCLEKFVSYIHDKQCGLQALQLFLNMMGLQNLTSESNDLKIFASRDDAIDANTERLNKLKKFRYETLRLHPEFNLQFADGKNEIIYQQFMDFAMKSKSEQSFELLSDSGIGLMLFCVNPMITIKQFPICELQLSCRGRLETIEENRQYSIVVGLICNEFSEAAKKQLELCLFVLEHAFKIYKGPKNPKKNGSTSDKINVRKSAKIFTATSNQNSRPHYSDQDPCQMQMCFV